MQKIDEFIEKLLEEKGISIDDPETKAEVKEEMREKLESEVNRACIEALSEEKAKELTTKINEPNFDITKMTEFMQNSGVDMEKIAAETMQRFREFYLNGEGKNV